MNGNWIDSTSPTSTSDADMACLYLLFVLKNGGALLFHHLEHHDPTQLPPDGHGHVSESRQLMHELQELLCRERWARDVDECDVCFSFGLKITRSDYCVWSKWTPLALHYLALWHFSWQLCSTLFILIFKHICDSSKQEHLNRVSAGFMKVNLWLFKEVLRPSKENLRN